MQGLQTQLNSAGSNREGYALAAGMALGLITLGRGHNTPALADLHLQDRLLYVPGPLSMAPCYIELKWFWTRSLGLRVSAMMLPGWHETC